MVYQNHGNVNVKHHLSYQIYFIINTWIIYFIYIGFSHKKWDEDVNQSIEEQSGDVCVNENQFDEDD